MTAQRTEVLTPQSPTGPAAGRRRALTVTAVSVALLLTLLLGIAIGRLTADVGLGDSGTSGVAGAEETQEQEAEIEVPEQLTWAPPELDDPEIVKLSDDDRDLKLNQEQDYILQMPNRPLTGPVSVWGGRNVVLIGGEIRIGEDSDKKRRALYLQQQTGTLHVEGLLISGDGLGEGINFDQREGATVQLQNIRIETVQGERDSNHADVIQTWAGPSVLRIDRLTGSTTYQGFFLLPNQHFDEEEPELFDLRHLNINGEEAAYLLWRDSGDWPLEVHNVWVSTHRDPEDRDQFLWARGEETSDDWDDVRVGTPPGGDFVPEDTVGIGYESPGYLEDEGSEG